MCSPLCIADLTLIGSDVLSPEPAGVVVAQGSGPSLAYPLDRFLGGHPLVHQDEGANEHRSIHTGLAVQVHARARAEASNDEVGDPMKGLRIRDRPSLMGQWMSKPFRGTSRTDVPDARHTTTFAPSSNGSSGSG